MQDEVLPHAGYPDTWFELMSTIDHSLPQPFNIDGYKHFMYYADPSGTTLTFTHTHDDFIEDNVTVLGPAVHTVQAVQLRPNLVHISLYHSDTKKLINTFIAHVDDPHLYPKLSEVMHGAPPFTTSNYSLGAITVGDTAVLMPWEGNFQIGLIARVGIEVIEQGDLEKLEKATSLTLVSGFIEKVEFVTNGLTGEVWDRIHLDCGFPLVVALKHSAEPKLSPGLIFTGAVLMTGSTGAWHTEITREIEQYPATKPHRGLPGNIEDIY